MLWGQCSLWPSLCATFKTGNAVPHWPCCAVLCCAAGRRPNVHNLGLEEAGVKMTKKGAIEVDDYSQTSVSGTMLWQQLGGSCSRHGSAMMLRSRGKTQSCLLLVASQLRGAA